ncbi:MAG: hypothetical protein ACFFAU_21505 [Candidatus Hodarchaeota archaeon]
MNDLEFQALLIQNLRSNTLLSSIRASFETFDEYYDKYGKEQEKKWTQIFILTISFIVSIVSVWVSVLTFPIEWKIILITGVIFVATLTAFSYLVKYEWFEREDRNFMEHYRSFDRALSKLNEMKFAITSTEHLIQILKAKKDHFIVIPEFTDNKKYLLKSTSDLFKEVEDVKDYLEDLSQKKEKYCFYFNEYYLSFYENLKNWWNKYKENYEEDL